MGGYAFILARICDLAGRSAGRGFGVGCGVARLIAAINKAGMMDSELAVSVYIDENKLSYDRRLNDLASNFGEKVAAMVSGLAASAQEMEQSAISMSARQSRGNRSNRPDHHCYRAVRAYRGQHLHSGARAGSGDQRH
jgi:hypothetical protein